MGFCTPYTEKIKLMDNSDLLCTYKSMDGQQKKSKRTKKRMGNIRDESIRRCGGKDAAMKKFPAMFDLPDEPFKPEPTYHLRLSKKYIQLFNSATRRGKEFNLELRDIHNLLRQRTCYYTGLEFDPKSNELKRTIDRVDNDKGYVKGNVVACTFAANQAKEALFERCGDIHTSISFYKNIVNALEKSKNRS